MNNLESKTDQNKKRNILIKTLFGLVFAIVSLFLILLIGENKIFTAKVMSFILYFALLCYSLFEFSGIFPLPKWARFYFPLLSFIPFLLPWDPLRLWFENSDGQPSINELVKLEYQMSMFGLPWIGYLVLTLLLIIPFCFIIHKKNLVSVLKEVSIFVPISLMMMIVAKLFFLINVENVYYLLVIIAGPILCDIFGYFGGMLLGNKIFKNKKLAPKISPKKTIEGAIIAFIVAWVVLFLIFWFVRFGNVNVPWIVMVIVLPITIPIVSINGDLLYSYIKRVFNVKDYSNIIPGHGGLLDRFDAIFLVSFVYFSLFIIT